MRNRRGLDGDIARFGFATMLAVALARPAPAHHSVFGFDGTRATEVVGTVAQVFWADPHASIALDVPLPDGRLERWSVESESPRLLERLGWTATTIRAGDRVTVLGARAKDGSTAMRCKHVELADGRKLPCFPESGARTL